MKFFWLAAFGGAIGIGCGGDGRPPTAPVLPVPILDAPCSEYDIGADGSIDIVYTFTYDAYGFMIKYVGSSGDVGDFTYDPDHFLLHYTEEYDQDPEPEYEETYTRDSYGRVLTFRQLSRDGSIGTAEYTYDTDGRLVSTTSTEGTQSSSMTYVYTGEQLNPTSARLVYSGGVIAYAFTSSRDQLMLHADMDAGEDGTVDATSDVTYDKQRRPIETVTREDGTLVSHEVRVYNDDGNLTSRTRTDTEGGPLDLEFYALFDQRGLQTERGIRSPSGQYMSSVYREVDKTVCAQARTTMPSFGARPMRPRPSAIELPQTFVAPRVPRPE